MRYFEPLFIALSTYSIIPVPQFDWNEKNMKYTICFFPAVGVICGAACYLWCQVGRLLAVSDLFLAAVAVCLPLLITGGIHMDGYMDTMDALVSHRSREKKLEILKDPHCGAFAVLYLAIYLILSFGLYVELLQMGDLSVICPGFVLSRALSACCAVNLPNANKAGMLCAYTKNTERKTANVFLGFILVLSAIGILCIDWIRGGMILIAAVCSVCGYYYIAMKEFDGVTGDTSGFFLQVCELACLFGAWLGGMIL